MSEMNIKMLKFEDYVGDVNNTGSGHLTAVELGVSCGDIPFEVKRMYWITKVPKENTRGNHTHVNLEQVFFCLNGKVKITLKTPSESQEIILDDPSQGLYVGRLTWREISFMSMDTVLLVLVSQHFDKNDYIRDFDEYCEKYELLK